MTLPARHSLAVIGAGPIGLEAAAAALDRGFDVHVFERGTPGAHLSAWGHVRMFTPWRMNVGPAARARLERSGWHAPDPDALPTGAEMVERFLGPLAALPEIASRVHAHAQVVHVSRRGAVKHDMGAERRAERPFRLLVRDAGGRENFLHAFAAIDASGVYGQPNRAGDGGIPARNELYLAPQMSYHVDDVLGVRRERYAGKRTLVIGAGASAATVVSDLVKLAGEAEGTAVTWVTRERGDALYLEIADDPLAERKALYARAREYARGGHPAVKHVGGALVEGFEFNSATHRYRTQLRLADSEGLAIAGDAGSGAHMEESDQVIVNTGFGPDDSIYRELQVHECYATRAPMKLAAALMGAAAGDCMSVPAFGVDVLANPEPNFFILGHKSYGRSPHFLLETGYRQVADVVEHLAAGLGVAAGG